MLERRALTLLVALTALFYWRYTLSDQFTFLETPDGANQVLPWLDFQARAWNTGVFPLWAPYQWGGQPLFGLMQPGAAFPLNWPLFALPLGDDGHIQLRFIHWQQTLLRLLGGLLAFALARELRISRVGALLTGLGFACVGAVASSGWPQITNGMVWAPGAAVFTARFVRRRDWIDAAAIGAMLGGAALSGHPRAPLFMAIAAAALLLGEAARTRKLRWAAAVPLVALVAACVGAMQLLPAWEFGRDAVRWVNLESPIRFDEPIPYFVDEALRLNPVHLFAVVIPIVPGPGDPYLGWTVLVLAALGVARGWREPGTWGALGVGLGALLYAFGPQTPLHGWIYGLAPLAEKARGASHALFLFGLAAFVLAGRGLSLLGARRPGRGSRNALLGFAFVAGSLVLAELVLGRLGDPAAVIYHGEFVMFSALAAVLLAGLLEALRRDAVSIPVAQAALIGLLLLEGGAAHWLTVAEQGDPIRATHLRRLDEPADAMAFLRGRPEPFRFEMVPGGGGINLGDRHGLESVEGYLTAVSGNVYQLMEERGWEHGRDLLNTVYTVARKPTRPNQQEVFPGADGWNVYRNPDARPRAWLETSCGEPGRATIPRRGLHSMTIETDSPCAGELILAEVWAPGWRAQANGEPREVRKTHIALRAVSIDRGHSVVELSYRPAPVVWGALISGFSVLLLAVVSIRRQKRS